MILAIDTATRWTAVGLHDGTAVIAEFGWFSAMTQTVELAPAVTDLLAKARLDWADLKAVAVAIGPGSYTGLRIGLAVAKGIALANGTPLIGVPTLDIVAHSLPESAAPLAVVAEAGRTRVCAGFYRWQPQRPGGRNRKAAAAGWQMAGAPVIESWPALIDMAAAGTVFAGEISPEATRLIRAQDKELRLVSPAAAARRAGYLAEIGWRRLRRHEDDDPGSLAPIYLRGPAGEVESSGV
jgi:tRNA threonylcarbamoyladenosine biosynthesis protein TsaB